MACNIEGLPAEISLLILENHVANLNDLSALIHASPVQYNVFRQHSIDVLAAVLKRAFHPSLMKLAIRTVLAQAVSRQALITEIEELLQWYRDRGHKFRFEDIEVESENNPDNGEDMKKIKVLTRLMKRSNLPFDQLECSRIAVEDRKIGEANSARQTPEIEKRLLQAFRSERCRDLIHNPAGGCTESGYLQDYTVLKKLCQLWRIVDYFVLNYVQAARMQQKLIHATNPWAYSDTDWECIMIPRKPSEVEYGRIQRAFLNFEMYRRMHGLVEPDSASFNKFMGSRYHWRLACRRLAAFEFFEFCTVYHHLLSYVADFFERAELHAEEQIKSAASKDCDSAQHDYISPSSDHFSSLPVFRQRGDLDIILSFTVKLGLPFLKKFSGLDTMQKMTILNRINNIMDGRRHREILFERNRFSNPWTEVRGDPLDNRSHGFALLGDGANVMFRNAKYLPIVEQGYIFWDDVKEVQNLEKIKYPFSTRRRHRDRDWSLEKQLYLHGWAISREALEASLPLVMTESEITSFVHNCDY